MKLTSRGTSLTEYALILGIAVVVFTITAIGQMNQEVKGTYKTVVSTMGGVTEDSPLNETNLGQWLQWSQTGSMISLEDLYAGKLSQSKPDEWIRLNPTIQFQYHINPQTGQLSFNLKDLESNISGNTTAVEGGEILKAFSQTMEKWAQENPSLTPAEKSELSALSEIGFKLAEKQITIDRSKQTQLYREDLKATLNAYNQLPMLYAQFNQAAQKSTLNEQALPLAALISSVTYYNYLSNASLEGNKNTLNQNSLFANVTLGIQSLYLPPTQLDMVKSAQNGNGQTTQQASQELQKQGV